MFGGEQLWECFSCGHSFTGGKRQDFCLPALQPAPGPAARASRCSLEGCCRCVMAAVLLEIIPALQIKGETVLWKRIKTVPS